MSRRRVVVLSSALAIFVVAALAVGAVVGMTRTDWGRERIRAVLEREIARRVEGYVHLGALGGSFFDGLTIDSLEIRDPADSLFVATGRISLSYDPRDITDRRLLFRHVRVEHPVVHIRKDSTDTWNYRYIFPRRAESVPRVLRTDRAFGDFVVVDSATLDDLTFVLIKPWTPADSLRGARRDSAVAWNLARDDAEIRRAGSGYSRTWRWTEGEMTLSHARLAVPDSAGQRFEVASLDVVESEPPFTFSNVRGTVHLLGDTIRLDVPHFDLPGSTGRGSGRIWWGSDLPTRYDLDIRGDSVSMADVSWIHPALPVTGGGAMDLHIGNDRRDLHVVEYALSNLDVRTTQSRLRGAMTFGVGGPVLVVTGVDLLATPANFDLLRTFNGGPFPYDYQGTLTGIVRGRGGPVNRFVIDTLDLRYDDAHVVGATSRATANGVLDILSPSRTVFHGFNLRLVSLDLRTPQALNPLFPRLAGTVTGTATLDSIWLDSRFRNGDLRFHDGDGPATRVTGNGRVTLGEDSLVYDLALTAQPLSFTTLARSYPALVLRGEFTGPLRIQGSVEDLLISGDVRGPGGTLAVDGRFDVFAPEYAGRFSGSFAALDLRQVLDSADMPVTQLNGRVTGDLRGDSLATTVGSLAIEVDRSLVNGVRVYPSEARGAFADRRLRVDTVRVESAAGLFAGRGALGLDASRIDTLLWTATLDSLGGLRPWIEGGDPDVIVSIGAPTRLDSLAGIARLDGRLSGSVGALSASGLLDAEAVWVGDLRARAVHGEFAILDMPDATSGSVRLEADTLRAGPIALASAGLDFELRDRHGGPFRLSSVSESGPTVSLAGDVSVRRDTTELRLDSLNLTTVANAWHLDRPALLSMHGDDILLDTLTVRGDSGGRVAFAANLPVSRPISVYARADSVPVADIGAVLQARVPYDGRLRLALDIWGTRDAPLATAHGALERAAFGDVRVDRVTLAARYGARRLDADATVFRHDERAVDLAASLPLDLALHRVNARRLPDTLSGRIRADSADFGVLEAFIPSVHDATGTLVANLDLAGTWDAPLLTGNLGVVDGALGIAALGAVRLRDAQADLDFHGDSVTIRRAVVHTREGGRAGSLSLAGGASVADRDNPRYDLQLSARDFHAIDRDRVAHLDVSADLQLEGTRRQATLTGGATVDRGTVYIPELAAKQLIRLDDPDLYDIVDTTVFTNRSLLPEAPPAFLSQLEIDNVQVRMGPDVWLRSEETNINLGGAVDVTVAPSNDRERPFAQLALNGSLLTNRGTWRLNLGIVQRTFEVEGGTIRFFGDADFNPVLDISALHTVRPFSSSQLAVQDVRIRARIGGTLAQPQLELSSADSLLQISESDLVSYLVTGAPNFDIAATGGVTQGTVSVLLRSGGSLFGDYLRSLTGLDLFDVQFGRQGGPGEQRQNATFADVLSNARFGVGKQVNDRTFISADAGVCQVRSLLGSSTSGQTDFWEGIGVKVETRLDANVSLSLGYEPPASALLCGPGGVASRGFVLTPRQFGLDLFRTWRF
jgi:translocation and assembly module TamB